MLTRILKSPGWSLAIAVGWFMLSTVLLLLPGSDLPKPPGFLEKIQFDKWVHAGIFGFMMFSCALAAHNNSRRHLVLAFFIFTVAFGIGIEFIQKNYIPNRSFDIGDIAADIAGSILGWFVFARWWKR